MAGWCIVGGCFRRRLRLDLEFATHRLALMVLLPMALAEMGMSANSAPAATLTLAGAESKAGSLLLRVMGVAL